MEGFTAFLRSRQGLQILDLGGLNQANLDFVLGLGHRLYSEDILRAFDSSFPGEEAAARLFPPSRLEEFLNQALINTDASCDGALLWDVLQFLPPPVTEALLDRLHRLLVPDSLLLAFFQPANGAAAAAPHSCRILESGQLQLIPRPSQRAVEPFTARSIERLFHRFSSVKFFLTREHLQEVIVKR